MAFETSTGGAGKTGLLSDKKVNLGSSRLRASVVKLLRDSKQARAAAALLYKDLLHELEANQLDGFTKKPVPMAIENQPCCREEAVEAMILSKLKGMHASAYQRLHAAAQVLSRVVYFHLARLTGDSLNGNNTRPTLLSLENNCPLDCPNRERRFIAGKTARTAAAALSSLVKLRQTGFVESFTQVDKPQLPLSRPLKPAILLLSPHSCHPKGLHVYPILYSRGRKV
eukprot:GHVT01000945.1.p1 GENE.GHVT01000945.1~~GHVT01000945.1.p1  ORF type:complete len:227 (+),score=8.10 GHVT01000945.1:1365-2045(+)